MLKKLLALRGTEPVRLILFPVIGVLVAYGVQRGVVTGDTAPYLLSILAVALGIPISQAVRSQVTPTAKVADAISDQAVGAVRKVANDLQLGPDSQRVLNVLVSEVENRVGRHRAR